MIYETDFQNVRTPLEYFYGMTIQHQLNVVKPTYFLPFILFVIKQTIKNVAVPNKKVWQLTSSLYIKKNKFHYE